ncbi:MAG: phosphatase PAP2 family protein [Ignavibacteria bacterium]|nr:phosphatase PAP2 family protein [Ignavibacteria bacterium]
MFRYCIFTKSLLIITKKILHIFILLIISLLLFSESDAQYRFRTVRDTSKYNKNNPDIKIFRTFNNINSSFLHSVVSVTNASVVPLSAAIPVGLYISGRADNNYYNEDASVLLAVSELTNALFTQGFKFLVKRDRPFRTLNNVRLFDTSSIANTYSFPSGHSSGSFAIATSLTLSYPGEPVLIASLYTYAVVTSLGRIYWGVHYPSDVLAGMMIGAGSAALIYSLRKPILEFKNNLFNQESRNYPDQGNPNTAALLVTVIGTDVLNYFLSGSRNNVLKNSSVSYLNSGKGSCIRYNLSF